MRIDRPAPGFFKTRLGRQRAWVPAVIWQEPARDPETGQTMERPPALLCIVDGEERDVYATWTRLHPVSEAEYRRLCRERAGVTDALDLNHTAVRI